MASFEDILNRPASEIKPPQAFPVGTYHCLVDGIPENGKAGAKQTDYLRFKLKILQPMEDVDRQAAVETEVVGKIIQHDIYVTEASAWRLVEFLADHLGISNENGRSSKEMLNDAPGKQVLVKLKHEPSQDGKRVFHRVESTAHV